MGGLSPVHWLIVLGFAAVLFGGRGKLSNIMGDAAKGIRAFKDGLKDEHGEPASPATPTQLAAAPPPPAAPAAAPPASAREDIRG